MNQAKVWFITGAGGGLGLCITRQLLARGQRVAATTRASFDALAALQAQYPRQMWVARLDVGDTDSIAEAVHAAQQHFGAIDVLISNAGYALLGTVEELSAAQIQQQLATNLHGPIRLIQAVLPYMRAQGAGCIVHMGSEAGQVTFPALGLYHATKWGMEGFCESLSQDLAPLNIHTIIVEPGRTDTDFDRHAQICPSHVPAYARSTVGMYKKLLAMGRFPNTGDPEKVARCVIEAAQAPSPALRLTLGMDAYTNIRKSLQNRLQSLHAQQETAFSVSAECASAASGKGAFQG